MIEKLATEECPFFWKKIIQFLEIDPEEHPEPTSKEAYRLKLNEFLFNDMSIHINEKSKFIKKIRLEFEEQRLGRHELSWLDSKNDRLCYWVWEWISMYTISENKGEPNRPITPYFDPSIPSYTTMNLSMNPNSTAKRFECIHQFFSMLALPAREKETLCQEIYESWLTIANTESFKWLNTKNTIQCEWFIEYINSSKEIIFFKAGRRFTEEPIDLYERLSKAIFKFDEWRVYASDKKLFIIKMKRAWSQKQHRDKLNGKKAYSMVMSDDVKSKLDEMAIEKNMHRNILLEQIINDSYDDFLGRPRSGW